MINAQENLTKARLNNSAAYDAAKNTLDKAASALNQAKENINLTAVSNKNSIATASASLESAKAALETAKNNLNNTKIKAISSGYVASKSVEVGQMAAAGTQLFTIKNTNTLVAEIEITETVIPFVSEGTKAVVNVSSAGAEDINGTVTLVNPVKNEQSGMYKVQVAVENNDSKLKIGMFAEVVLVTRTSEAAIVIPTDAILIEGEKSYVYIAMPDGKTAKKREITVGIESDSTSEIIDGIEIGDRVIISGQDYLSEENNEINIVTE
jgi:RND family efflux transporter MFP subunit